MQAWSPSEQRLTPPKAPSTLWCAHAPVAGGVGHRSSRTQQQHVAGSKQQAARSMQPRSMQQAACGLCKRHVAVAAAAAAHSRMHAASSVTCTSTGIATTTQLHACASYAPTSYRHAPTSYASTSFAMSGVHTLSLLLATCYVLPRLSTYSYQATLCSGLMPQSLRLHLGSAHGEGGCRRRCRQQYKRAL